MNLGTTTDTPWYIWWERITRPSSSLQNEDKQQARLLASLSLTVLLLGLIAFPAWLLIVTDGLWATALAGGMLTAFVLVYYLSRVHHYIRGAVLLSLSMVFFVIINIWLSPSPMTQRMLMLMALFGAVMVSVVFLHRTFTLLLVSVCLLIITAHFFVPGLPFVYPFAYLSFFVALTGLTVVIHAVDQGYKRELADSQARYRALFNQAHDAVFMLNLKGKHIEANQQAADMLGYTLAEINRLSISSITAEPEQSNQVLERLLAGEHVPAYERRFRHKNGTIMSVEVKVKLIRNATGQPTHIQSVVRDITSLKEKEQEFWLQRAALQATANAIVIADANGIVQWCNSAYSHLTQYTLEEIVGKNFRELVKSGVQDQDFYRTLWDTILSGQVWQGTLINQRKDGSHYTEEQTITPLADTEGNITHFVTIKQDVTQREASAQALRQAELRQRTLLNATPDLMFRLDHEGTYLDYHANNPEELFVPPEQFLGRKTTEVLPDKVGQTYIAHIKQVLQTNQRTVYEYELIINDRRFCFESYIVPADANEVLAIVRNVTRQRAWQKQATELILEKERAKTLRQFIQSSSHELRTPLTVINSYLYLLQKIDNPVKQQHYLAQSEAQIVRMVSLLDVVTEMVQLDSGVPFVFTETDINDLLMQLVAYQFNEDRGRLHLSLASPLPLCQVDAAWLQKGIGHILDNAVRFTTNGEPVYVRTKSNDGQVIIEIEDKGVGINNEHLPHLFGRFWRHDKDHGAPGFGLGLPIAQRIIENHAGYIEVESTVGQGSCFRIFLPFGAKFDS